MRATSRHGLTLIEVLIALAVIGIAFAALGFVQLTNLQASSASRLVTETKAAANAVLEDVLAMVLATESCAPAETYCDSTGVYYAFNDYYWLCPTPATPSGSLSVRTPRAIGPCSGTQSVSVTTDRNVPVTFSIGGEAGIEGQGVLSVQVTATHPLGNRTTLTIGDRITCFDVYPTPTSEAPAPCPNPADGGR